jgi:asparagine synthase (glutamine-hydrolysing)
VNLSDELFCYLYGSNAPSELDYYNETINLVSNVHLFDCLRANKISMANSIEVRVPFTDPNFINYVFQIPNKYKIFGKLEHCGF